MMTGDVTAQRKAVLSLTIRMTDGKEYAYEGVIDTGYTGSLTLPPELISALGLRWYRYGSAILADGNRIQFNVYKTVVIWDGQPSTITIDEMDANSLIGMSLMYGYELTLRVLYGATFTLQRIVAP